jgi:hypothetical protein
VTDPAVSRQHRRHEWAADSRQNQSNHDPERSKSLLAVAEKGQCGRRTALGAENYDCIDYCPCVRLANAKVNYSPRGSGDPLTLATLNRDISKGQNNVMKGLIR